MPGYTPDVAKFAETPEKVCLEAAEAAYMTRNLAVLIAPD